MLPNTMKRSLENKFGKNPQPSIYSEKSDHYIGDNIDIAVSYNKYTDEKKQLMKDGLHVGYNIDDKQMSDDFATPLVFYDYPIKNELDSDLSQLQLSKNDRINICCFTVATNGLKPYLKYLLYKYPQSSNNFSDLLVFPFFIYEENQDIQKISTEMVLDYLDNIAGEESLQFVGYKKTKDGVNLFIELNSHIYQSLNEIRFQSRSTNLWFVLIKEIIDNKNVINFPIHHSVTNFFLHNKPFLFLLDKNGVPYTLPLVAYHGNYYKVISFVSVFGLKRSSVFSSLGPYYYFGTYEKALRYAVWTHTREPMIVDGKTITINNTGKYDKGGIVRFAIFPGNAKVFLNRPNDPEDSSELSQSNNKDDWISLNSRLRDADGVWAETFNSVYQGVMILANGKKNQRGPHWVLRDYAQQTPLTYHYVDTSKFDDSLINEPTYYKDNIYYID
jgi:hypothetical protein